MTTFIRNLLPVSRSKNVVNWSPFGKVSDTIRRVHP